MKKAFTIIELIFIIAIIGILASVAISKLFVTKDDANLVKVASNISTMINDLNTYYISNNSKFSKNFNDMTNINPKTDFKIDNNNICLNVTTKTIDDRYIIMNPIINGKCVKVWKLNNLQAFKNKLEANQNKFVVNLN